MPAGSPSRLAERVALACIAAATVLLSTGAPALARPADVPAAATPTGQHPSRAARPTVDRSEPTPTSPDPGGPPEGSAPDGSTVGGSRLHTRGLVVADGAPSLPAGISAPGWLVADLGSGAVLGARDPHGRYFPASTLKTLTLLTLSHRLSPGTVVTATEADEQVEGTRVGLVKGGQYPVSLLFQALILGSGNDVANALARTNGGVEVTVTQMNATAESLGAFDTVAGTPSGLDVAGQSSSPYDLALIFRALLADPQTAAVLATPRIQMPPEMGKTGFQVDNENPLLVRYPGDLGGKNGFTDAARHTFVSAAERNGRRLVVALMGAQRQPGTSEYDQAARLLDWGFAVPPGTAGVGVLVRPGQVPTWEQVARSSPTPPSPRRSPAAAGTAGRGAGLPLGGIAVGGLAAAAIVASATFGIRRARRRPGGIRSAPPG